MPSRRTSSGRRGVAMATRFWTSTCALSRSVPSLKVMVSDMAPSLGGVGGHVEHVLDAVDLLLERRRDGFGDRLRVSARIGGAHDDGRRRDLGILRDRQARGRRCRPPAGARSTGPTRRSADRRRNGRTAWRLASASARWLAARRQRRRLRLDLHAGPHPHQAVDDDGLVAVQARRG